MKTGAQRLLETAAELGAKVCFANPGTTEMDLVGALDRVPDIRPVLGLFEGVCTGMADGYARMTRKPGLTLLHLGVGLGNGIANLHNARRARSPIINMVGDHPDAHLRFDAPLTSDLEGLSLACSHWTGRVSRAEEAEPLMRTAWLESTAAPGRIATLLAAADAMQDPVDARSEHRPSHANPDPCTITEPRLAQAVDALRSGETTALLLGGTALFGKGLDAAGRVAAETGADLLAEPFPPRLERGAGTPVLRRLPYFPEDVLERLAPYRHLVLLGAPSPVSFFRYPDYPASLVPEGVDVVHLADDHQDGACAVEVLADALNAKAAPKVQAQSLPDAPSGGLDTKSAGAAIAAALPEGAIVADESATSGGSAFFLTQTARPHTGMYLTGGGIGMGLPLATGAAVAGPGRPVLALQGDGGGMYTPQALWTQAREGLDVVNVIFANRSYHILRVEQARAGISADSESARALTDLQRPALDWCALAQGMGVPATRPEDAHGFHQALERAFAAEGPSLIEVVL